MYKKDALESLSEEQIRELALFAKNLLDSTGIASTLTELNQCVTDIIGDCIGSGGEEYNRRAYLLSLFLESYLKIIERTYETGKTLTQLMGVEFDRDFYGTDK